MEEVHDLQVEFLLQNIQVDRSTVLEKDENLSNALTIIIILHVSCFVLG